MEIDVRRAAGAAAGETVAVLVSGGLDSAVLTALLAAGGPVVPIYVSCGLSWEQAERDAVNCLRELLTPQQVRPLVELAMPLADLYGEHWSVTGTGVPAADTDDAAVELLGRNALLALKPLLWCAREGVRCLAIATLSGNPFADASRSFLSRFAGVLSTATTTELALVAPFETMSKQQVVRAAAPEVLAASMSCLAPVARSDGWWHCGSCNKCSERQRGFREAGVADPTSYEVSAAV